MRVELKEVLLPVAMVGRVIWSILRDLPCDWRDPNLLTAVSETLHTHPKQYVRGKGRIQPRNLSSEYNRACR